MKRFTVSVIRIECAGDRSISVEAFSHACGLAYHRDLRNQNTYVVTHIASGKLLMKPYAQTERQVRAWIEALKDQYDWWYLEIDPKLKSSIEYEYKKVMV